MNYPVIKGLIPWSLTVPWPIEFFMFIDGLDRLRAAYYTLKRVSERVAVAQSQAKFALLSGS